MSLTADEITESLRRTSLNSPRTTDPNNSQPHPPRKSFLQSMNEKLAQKQRKPRTRNRNTRRPPTAQLLQKDPTQFYIVEDEKQLLGVYSTVKTATKAARLGGALESYLERWAEEGIRDCGNRVRILPFKLQTGRVLAEDEVESSTTEDVTPNGTEKEESKPDINPRKTCAVTDAAPRDKDATPQDGKEDMPPPILIGPVQQPNSVYVALDRSLTLGLFPSKSLAWDACMKHKAQMTYAIDLAQEKKWVDKNMMPYLKGWIGGSGLHCWYVRVCIVDEMPAERKRAKGVQAGYSI